VSYRTLKRSGVLLWGNFQNDAVVISDPGTMSGAPVFRGTRVPVSILLDYPKAGDAIENFLEGCPTVGRDQVTRFLEAVKEMRRPVATVRTGNLYRHFGMTTASVCPSA